MKCWLYDTDFRSVDSSQLVEGWPEPCHIELFSDREMLKASGSSPSELSTHAAIVYDPIGLMTGKSSSSC